LKKFIIWAVGFWVLAGIFIIYPEYKTRNFVDSFITSEDNVEEVIQGISIRKDGAILATLKPTDEQFDELLTALRSWEIKKTSKDKDPNQETYELTIMNDALQYGNFQLSITEDGMMDIRGSEYELVSGSSIEEIVKVAK